MSTSYTKEQALELVHMPEDELFNSATVLREANFTNTVELCAIINARSGQCAMDCSFCAQSVHHDTHVSVFDLLSAEEIGERLAELSEYPLHRVGLVTSGGALHDNHVESLVKTLEGLPEHWQGRICGSLGRLSYTALLRLKSVGLSRYHHNLESSSTYYTKLCNTQTWNDRLNTVISAQKIMPICSGGIFGLGESWEDRIDLAFTLREHNIEQVPINFLYPHEGTPLAKQKPLESAEALRIIALFRHILPTATLRICGGRPLVLRNRQNDIFAAGANAFMTGNYLTTDGHGIEDDIRMAEQQGLKIIT